MTNEPRTRTLTTKAERKGQCRSSIEFGDNFGDNTTTFYCQLPPKHDGDHVEKGSLYGTNFEVIWGRK